MSGRAKEINKEELIAGLQRAVGLVCTGAKPTGMFTYTTVELLLRA